MEEKLISLIMPAYNCEATIEKCVKSILNQTYTNYEVIIVNDGSIDATKTILERLENSKIKVFHKQNGGVSSARNYGIEKSTGDYIAFIDSDDYIQRDMLKQMIEDIQKQMVDLVICPVMQDFYKRRSESKNKNKRKL